MTHRGAAASTAPTCTTWAGGGEGPSLAGPETEAGFHVSWVYIRSTAITRRKVDLHYHWTRTGLRTHPAGLPPQTGAGRFQPHHRRAFRTPENSPALGHPHTPGTPARAKGHPGPAGRCPSPADRCQPPGAPGSAGPAQNRRRGAAGGPRGGNQDHIQRESRLNFQPRVCRGAWSCLVNAAGNTWDTLTALIVPTHSAVDEL